MIRFKVFIPAVLVVALAIWVFTYKIDGWLRDWIEDGISAATNTKTDITGLRLSFRDSSLLIKRLEVGSSKDEFKNAVEFEEIVVDFQTLPLLQKRFVVDEFSIRGIQWGTKRRTSAKLPPRPKSTKPSWISEQLDEGFAAVKKEFRELPVAKLTDFKMPKSPADVLRTLDLQSEKELKEVIAYYQDLRGSWTTQIHELRDISDYKLKIKEAKSLTKGAPQDPKEILRRVETIKGIIEFFKHERERVNELAIKVRTDWETAEKRYRGALDAVEADYQRAADMISLDQLNVDNLSRLIFGSQWITRAENVIRYHRVVKSKLDALKSEEAEVQVRERAKGRDIIFVTPKKQPAFVLASSQFSVKSLEKGRRAEVNELYELDLKHINSNPKLYGMPTEFSVKASIKEGPFATAALTGFLDHTQSPSKDLFEAKVEKINASDWPMGIPKFFPLKMGSGLAKAAVNLNFKGDDVDWVNTVKFSAVKWDFSGLPGSGLILRAIKDVLKEVKAFELKIRFLFAKDKFKFSVTSDLDQILSRSISSLVDKELKAFKARLKKEIERRVGQVKSRAQDEVKKFENEVRGKITTYQKTLRDYEKQAQAYIKELENKAKKAAENKVKQELKKNLPKVNTPKIKKPAVKDLKKLF